MYSSTFISDAAKRLGFRVGYIEFEESFFESVLAQLIYGLQGFGEDAILKTKMFIVRGLDVEDYPKESDADLNEANINDLVYTAIITVCIVGDALNQRSGHLKSEVTNTIRFSDVIACSCLRIGPTAETVSPREYGPISLPSLRLRC